MNKVVGKIIRTCGYLIGFSVLLYPTVSKYVNTLHGTSVVSDYQQQVSHTTEDMENQMLEDARAYNKRLIGASAGDPFAGGIKKENEEYENRKEAHGFLWYYYHFLYHNRDRLSVWSIQCIKITGCLLQ